MDDTIVEEDEVICVHIERVEGTATLSETGNSYALLTVKDNEKQLTTLSYFTLCRWICSRRDRHIRVYS